MKTIVLDSYARRMVSGSLATALARAAVIPFGVMAVIVLARKMGPDDLGAFAVASSIIWWVQLTLNAFFSRAAIRLIAEAADWQPVATALIQLHFLAGVVAGALLFAMASPIASLLMPNQADALRLFAWMVPILSLAQGHENALVGCRAFRRSALFPLWFDGGRALFILLFVGLGGGLVGAVLAQLAAALAELAYARWACPLSLFTRVAFPLKRVARYSGPLFLEGVARHLNARIDLWSVQAFVGAAAAGWYSAAQSALVPVASLTVILSPLLLATLTDAWRQGHREAARTLVQHVLRLLSCLLPFMALFAGAAPELVTLVFGRAFAPAAPLLAWLSVAAFANCVLSFVVATLAAMGRPGVVATFTLPMLLASVLGSLLLVPRIGAIGAAATTTITFTGAMVACLWILRRRCGVAPDRSTVLRVIPLAVPAYVVTHVWQVPGLWAIPQLLGLSAAVLGGLFAVRVLTRDEVIIVRSLLWHPDASGAEVQSVASAG